MTLEGSKVGSRETRPSDNTSLRESLSDPSGTSHGGRSPGGGWWWDFGIVSVGTSWTRSRVFRTVLRM